MLHPKIESRELPGLAGEKIQEIPLGHESDELAVRRHIAEVADPKSIIAVYAADGLQFLVRHLQEIFQDAELIHKFQG